MSTTKPTASSATANATLVLRRFATRLVGCASLYMHLKGMVYGIYRSKAQPIIDPADDNIIAHPAVRQFTPQQLQTIEHLSSTRPNPRNIIGLIKKDTPTQLVKQRDIWI
ncbi:hypothetical protein N7461_006078 [Penicillium sp. DV-2018c]|nr:hypothetical protein N7461_006078 [Penicillium sp. DV-2018c]